MRSAGCAAHPENEIWIRFQVMMTAKSLKDEDQKDLVGAVQCAYMRICRLKFDSAGYLLVLLWRVDSACAIVHVQ